MILRTFLDGSPPKSPSLFLEKDCLSSGNKKDFVFIYNAGIASVTLSASKVNNTHPVCSKIIAHSM